jgi:hypothetical protein
MPFQARAALVSALLAFCARAHEGQHHFDAAVAPPAAETWLEKYGEQADLGYTGPLSFAHLPYARCLEGPEPSFDLAILGMPCVPSHRARACFRKTGVWLNRAAKLRHDGVLPPRRALRPDGDPRGREKDPRRQGGLLARVGV